ncbi:acyl-CoA dehydrogenase family protein [Dehalococcoidia bacterium]|nr:acyl-CoA dehydrogenase family protein [Dehalococcoidia bacterium]
MNFALEYTYEQEVFRQEVRTWLAQNIPENLVNPVDPKDLTYEQYQKRRTLGRAMGSKGWLWPTAPVEYGGGGLSMDYAIIIEEELERNELTLPPYYDSGGRLGGASILVWGSAEQKQQFLPPIFKGDVRTWQLLTEPVAGSDLAGIETTAKRDGDSYVINGQKVFVGSTHGAEQSWMIVVTDPHGERHHNLSWFIVPMNLPGISVVPMELLTTGGEGGAGTGQKNTIYFDEVRVPVSNLIGGENNGWAVATTHLELEHGGGGSVRRNALVDKLINYCRETMQNSQPLSSNPDIRDSLVDIYIDAEIGRLLRLRNYWLAHTKQPRSYEGPQASLHGKMSGLRIAENILQILGPYALTNDIQYRTIDGSIELHQRASIVAVHPGGTAEIQKVIMARRIGIGRTIQEKAGTIA